MERQGTIFLLSNFIHFYGKDTVSTLHYFHGSKDTGSLCPGGVCLNFTEIKDFRLPIRLYGKLFVGIEIEVKTPIYKRFKPGPEILKGRE